MNLEYIFRILAEGYSENDGNPLDKGNRESDRLLHHTINPLREFRNIGDSYGPLVFLEIVVVTPEIFHMLRKKKLSCPIVLLIHQTLDHVHLKY